MLKEKKTMVKQPQLHPSFLPLFPSDQNEWRRRLKSKTLALYWSGDFSHYWKDHEDDGGAWLPDGFSQIYRSYVSGPLGFWNMAPPRYAAKCDPFLSLDCAPTPSTPAHSKERKGSNFAIWQPL